MKPLQIIAAPSILGLKPNGVEKLPAALRKAGLLPAIYKTKNGYTEMPDLNAGFNPERDEDTLLLNGPGIAAFALRLADTLTPLYDTYFPLVLGGDCSILLGPALSLKQRGRYGLVHVDAHADFYQPSASTLGEVADMDLAIVSGRGPAVISDINSMSPYVPDEDIVQIGQRDMEEAERYGSRDIRDTTILRFDMDFIRRHSINTALQKTVAYMEQSAVQGFWIHFDADVLSDDMMPAVEYRLPGGLTQEEATLAIRTLSQHPKAMGMTVTIYNPLLDDDGKAGNVLTAILNEGLA
ncbi:arginase family protein [Chitinophaga sp.]|uniref:arginase family protein n=1 Tax=Chitinophaga sp. TaxID=1869181 RepID=UPI0031E46873